MLMKQVIQTAQVKSFDDCFFIATMIALAGLLPALFLKREHHRAVPHPVPAARPDAATAPAGAAPVQGAGR
jgi:hypothetical protein